MGKRFYDFFCAVARPVYAVLFPPAVEGLENIPAEGGFIVVSNHCHARDPFYLAAQCRSRRFHFMAKAELFKFPPLAAFLRRLEAFPVDRGHSDLNAVRTSLKLLADGCGLGLFPQGTRSRDNSLRAGRPVIPAYIGGPYRLFRRTQLSFGAPVSFEGLPRRVDSATLDAATRRIEDAVWGLKRADL